MSRTRRALALSAAIFALAGLPAACSRLPPPPQSAFDREAQRVRGAVETLIAADNRGDLEGVIACYTQDVVLTPPAGAAIAGREAVRSHYQALFERYRLSLRARIAQSAVVRDAATVSGRTTGRRVELAGGGETAIDDDFVAELVLEDDGRWRIRRLTWTPHRG